MTLKDAASLGAFALLFAGAAAVIALSDGALIARHSAALDVPYSRSSAHEFAKDEPLDYVLSDSFNLILPDAVFTGKQLHAGRFPLWNPDIIGGVPHLANPLTASASPPHLLALLLFEPIDALLALLAFHLSIAAIFSFLFLRTVGVGLSGSWVGALGFVLSGWIAAHLKNGALVDVVCWFPLGLYGLERALRSSTLAGLSLMAVAIGMAWLSGFPQLALLTTTGLGVFAAVGLVRHTARVRSGGWILGYAILGLGIAAVQLAPTLELKAESGHQDASKTKLEDQRFRGIAFTGLVLPRTFGDPRRPEAGNFFGGLALGEARPELNAAIGVPPVMNWSERTLFPGVLLLLLALCAPWHGARRPLFGLLAVGAFGVLAASVWPVISALSHVPGFDVGAPARSVVLLVVTLPLIGGLGTDVVLRSRSAVFRRCGLPLVAGLLLLAVGVLAWFYLDASGALETLLGSLKAWIEDRFQVTSELPVSTYLNDASRAAFADLRKDMVGIGGALAVLTTALLLVRRQRESWAAVVLVSGVAGELLAFLAPVNQPVTRRELFEPTPGLRFLMANQGDGRLIRISRDEASAVRDADRLLVPNLPLVSGLRDAQAWREQIPLRTLRLFEGVSAFTRDVGVSGVVAEKADSLVLDLARVTHGIASEPIPSLAAQQVYPAAGETTADLWIYENPDPLPHAWVVHDVRRLDDEAALLALRAREIDPWKTVIVPEETVTVPRVTMPSGSKKATVQMLIDEPDRLVIAVESPAAGHLVINDSWAKGWSATWRQGGRVETRDVVRAMTCYRAVAIDAGSQEIELVYRPLSVVLGLAASAASLLALVILGLCSVRRRRRATTIDAPPEASLPTA